MKVWMERQPKPRLRLAAEGGVYGKEARTLQPWQRVLHRLENLPLQALHSMVPDELLAG